MELAAEGAGITRQPQRFTVTINGLSWPYTERFDFAVGDTVRWRWINATKEHHPMHLHGFYYRVDALGDERADTVYAPADRKLVVTQRIEEGGTMAMTWVPDRPGNWLFHCHLRAHSGPDSTWGFPDVPRTPTFGSAVAPDLRSTTARGTEASTYAGRNGPHDMGLDMAGLILGIRVRPAHNRAEPRAAAASTSPRNGERHEVRLTVLPYPTALGALPVIAARVDDPRADADRASAQSAGVGPPIVLRRGEPARVTVVNSLPEPTALHWHGIELESYFDGVPGWSGGPGGGAAGRLSPAIAPRDSFAALMTPPRAGTFIYHSHALMSTQLGDGLYGPLIVLGASEAYDPLHEVTWIVGGRERTDTGGYFFLNGERAPKTLSLAAGRRYRVRLINITENNAADVALLDGDASGAAPVEWRPLAKDAVPIPDAHAGRRAALLRTSVGETYDFELLIPRPGVLRLEIRNQGDLMVQQRVVVR